MDDREIPLVSYEQWKRASQESLERSRIRRKHNDGLHSIPRNKSELMFMLEWFGLVALLFIFMVLMWAIM